MSEEKDFDFVVGKLPRKDKDGNDATGDKIGKGGRHRDDGTFSGMAYDLQVVDEDPTKPKPAPQPTPTPQPKPAANQRQKDLANGKPVERKGPSYGQQMVMRATSTVTNRVASRVADYAAEKTVQGIDNVARYAWNRFKQWWNGEDSAQTQQRTTVPPRQSERYAYAYDSEPQTTNKQQSTAVSATRTLPDEFDAAFEHYQINMTSKEAKRELLEAYVLHLMSAKKVWRVAHANITDDDGTMISGQEMINKFCSPEIIGEINKILQYNPDLLENWAAKALEGLLGRSLMTDDERYIPFDGPYLKEKLLAA